MRVVGPLMLVLGLLGLAVGAFHYTREKEIVDVGPIEIRSQDRESVRIPPLLAGAVAVVGGMLTFAAYRPRR